MNNIESQIRRQSVDQTPKISEVIHYAADTFLWDGEQTLNYIDNQKYSCDAISATIGRLHDYAIDNDIKGQLVDLEDDIFAGLENMGLRPNDLDAFFDIDYDKQQQYRYAWLKFVAMIAEEQGVWLTLIPFSTRFRNCFGDNVVDPETHPIMAKFQFTVAKWELENLPQEKVDTEQPA